MKINFIKIFTSYLIILVSSVILSISFSWLFFDKIYQMIFQPTYVLNLLTMGGESFDLLLGGFLLAYSLLLPMLSIIFITKKQWLPWLIFTVPFIIFYFGDSQWILYFAIFTIIGAVLGYLIRFTYKKI